MRNVRQVEHGAQAGAFSYAAYTAFVLDVYEHTGRVPPVRVQVQKRGVTFCGKVLDASAGRDETDWFKVDCQLGQLWFPHEKVRLCSGDGRCTCEAPEGAEGRACAAPAPAGAVPLGNTGTTTEVAA